MASRAAIYGRLASSRIRGQVQYRLSFVFQLIGTFLLTFLDFITVLVIFTHLPQLGGWTLPEIAFLYGSSYMTFKAADLVMSGLDRLPLMIRSGTFDQMLTRPLGTLGQVMTSEISIRQIASMGQGGAVFAYALSHLSIDWTAPRVLVFAGMVASSFVIFCAVFVTSNAIAFWLTDAREVANSFTYGGQMVTQYPLHIFGVWFRRMLGFVVPLAFVNYFPSLYLLAKSDPLHAPEVLRFLSPAVAVAVSVVTAAVWRVAVRRYRSTGS